MEHTSSLSALGLGPRDELVLDALLDGCDGTVDALSKRTGLSATAVRSALATLEGAGLASREPGPPGRLVPAPPDIAIEAMILEREEHLQRTRIAAAELGERYRRLATREPSPVELVVGRDAVLERFFQLQRVSTSEVLAFDAPPYLNPGHGQPNPAELAALAKGVRYRVVYALSALEHPGQIDLLRTLVDAGEEARIHARVPMKFLVADRHRALVPLVVAEPAGERALVVHPCALLDALLELFELVWERARPFGTADGDPPGDGPSDDSDLLALLAAGLKDEAIARQLGIADRTLRRRVGRIMEDLGVSSRFAAGVEAVRRGWIRTRTEESG